MSTRKSLAPKLIIGGVLLIVAAAAVAVILPNLLYPKTNLWLGDGIFRATIAKTSSDRSKGLLGQSGLASDQALIMVFDKEDRWAITMNGMEIDLDIVWLDKNKKVVHIVKNASPDSGTFEPSVPAQYVIELSAGTVDRKSINRNSVAIFEMKEGGVE